MTGSAARLVPVANDLGCVKTLQAVVLANKRIGLAAKATFSCVIAIVLELILRQSGLGKVFTQPRPLADIALLDWSS